MNIHKADRGVFSELQNAAASMLRRCFNVLFILLDIDADDVPRAALCAAR
jgi:hypothetical protein